MSTGDDESSLHRLREVAEGFGSEAERYDRTRPAYPPVLVQRLLEQSPGTGVLDVGCGTGILGRQLRDRGARVLGLEPDVRMAEVARVSGLDVEVGRIEGWEPRGRRFDLAVAGQAWHWVDPAVGSARVAAVLRPGGRVAMCWNAADVGPELASRLADAYERALPDAPVIAMYRSYRPAAEGYAGFLDAAADGLAAVGACAFEELERWRDDWEHDYTRDEWLEQTRTQGANPQLPPDRLDALLAGVGEAVDAVGGGFTMSYATLTLTAVRAGDEDRGAGRSVRA